MIFAERESNIRPMARTFTPPYINEESLSETQGLIGHSLKSGDDYGPAAGVVEVKDGKIYICYFKKPENCEICTTNCPFRGNEG